jgi:transcriptional regulator with XRE-family HTH domain
MQEISRFRDQLGWSQKQMAGFIGLSQSAISEMELGRRPESGPVAALLDGLSAALADGRVAVGVDPMAARAVVLSLPPDFQRGEPS